MLALILQYPLITTAKWVIVPVETSSVNISGLIPFDFWLV